MTSSLPRQFESRDGRTATGLVVLLTVCLAALLAGAGEYLLAQSFEPSSPAKEYVYVGGRLVAVEVIDPATIPVTIEIANPPQVELGPQGFWQFELDLNPLDNPTGTHPVTWGFDGPAQPETSGTITQGGRYEPPEDLAGSVVVKVTSGLAPNPSATATVTFDTTGGGGPITVTVTGDPVPPPDLLPGETYNFQVAQNPATPVLNWEWTTVPLGVGLIEPQNPPLSTLATYTAPLTINTPQTIQIRAADVANAGTFGEISVNLIPPPVPDGPDLVVTNLWNFPSSVASGGYVGSANISIQNQGNQPAGSSNFAVKFCTSQTEGSCEASNLTGGTIGPLDVDESVTIGIQIGAIPFQQFGGTYYLAGVADSGPTLDVIEQDENNNYLFKPITVQNPVPGNPDLVLTHQLGHFYPTAIPPGGTISVGLLYAHNDGGGVADGTNYGIDMGLYISDDNDITPSDDQKRTCELFTDILGGQGYLGCQPLPDWTPGPTTVGTYFMGGIIDWTNQENEGSLGETNNATPVTRSTGQDDGMLIVTHEANLPDLRGGAMTVPAAGDLGQAVTFTAETTHGYNGLTQNPQWQIDAEAPLRVAFFLTPNLAGGLSESQDRFLGSCAIATDLGYGDEDTCNLNVALPADMAPGRYAVWSRSDDHDKYNEYNEFNNYINGGEIDISAPTTSVPQALDAGFETTTLNNWSQVGTATADIDGDYAYHGAQSLKLTGDVGGVEQFVTGLTPGTAYRVTAWARGPVDPGNWGTSRTALEVGEPAIAEDSSRTLSDQSFQQFSADFIAPATGTVPIRLLRPDADTVGWTSTIYWDDVTVESLSAPQPQNAGFESGTLTPGWSAISAETTATIGSTANSGTKGLEISVSLGSGGVTQDVTGLTAGKHYSVSVRAQADASAVGTPILTVDDTTGANSVSEFRSPISTTEFETIQAHFVATSTGTARIQLIYTGGAGSVYFDDVTIAEDTAPQADNADFEITGAFTSEPLYPWVLTGDATGSFSTAAASSGTKSLQITSGAAAGGAYQDVAGLIAGQRYEISVNAKASAGTPTAQLRVHDREDAGEVSTTISTSATEFNEIRVIFRATSTGAARIVLENTDPSTTIYWDEVVIQQTNVAQPVNEGFESGLVQPWVPFGDVDTTAPVVVAAARTGSGGLELKPGGANPPADGVYTQDVYGFVPGQKYRVTAWARSGTASQAQARLGVHDATSGAGGWIADLQTVDDSGFVRFSVDYEANESGAIRVHLYRVSGTVHWDDVSITPLVTEVNFDPVAVSVSPSSGSGASQIFTVTARDANGGGDIDWIELNFSDPLVGPGSCFVRFEQATNEFFLRNDAGSAWSVVTGGSASSVENSQCILNGTGSSFSVNGTDLVVNVDLTFKSAYAGLQKSHVQLADGGGTLTWQELGSWTVENDAPDVTVVTPSSGSGNFQAFTATTVDENGFSDMKYVQLNFSAPFSNPNSCWVMYNRISNTLQLRDDASTVWMAGITPGTASTLENSQCTLHATGSSSTESGNQMVTTFNITFNPNFAGAQTIWAGAYDGINDTRWVNKGSWTVPTPGSTPAPFSITPSAGSGSTQTFTATFVDGDGATDMNVTYWMFNGVINWTGSCGTHYNRTTNLFYVIDDAGLAWGTGVAPGSATVLSNSTCEIDVSGVTATSAGNVLTVTFPVTFLTNIGSTRNSYLWVNELSGANSGWQQMGTWTVPGTPNQAPTADSVAPSSGSGLSETFTVKWSDGNGTGDIGTVFWLANTTLSGLNGCYVRYISAADLMYLLDDGSTTWGTGVAPGSAGTMANSMCSVDPAGASASTAGNTITLTFPVTFDLSSEGQQNVWTMARDNAGVESGWQQLGTWDITETLPLLEDDFNSGTLDASWTVVDDGTRQDPSNWFVDVDVLRQNRNIWGGSGTGGDLQGTYLVNGSSAWTDYTMTVDTRSTDNDAIGVLFRYQNKNNYYGFAMDRQQNFRMLYKRSNDNVTVLASDNFAYTEGQWYEHKVVVVGNNIRVYFDGQLLFDVTDTTFDDGKIALLSWGNTGAHFDNVVVVEGDATQ